MGTAEGPAEPPAAAEVVEVNASLKTAEAALAAHDYDQAAAALIKAQESRGLDLKQSLALHQSMRDLQSRLIEAASGGDPKAEAAIRLLKASGAH